jgi:cyclophilin family peptidyl-prolyl cis-trans isomerase/HEAT repeat protein
MLARVVLLSAMLAAQTAAPLRDRMLAAEDARVIAAADLAPLLQGLRSSDPRLVVQAVRALGRFERPELVKVLMPLVSHVRPEVRAEAANAVGQSLAAVPRGADETAPLPIEAATVTRTLLARLTADPDPGVVGVVAETLGRLPYRSAQALAEVETALVALLPAATGGARHPKSMIGAAKGLETRIRVYQKLSPPSPGTIAGLRAAATLAPAEGELAYVRRVAWTALNGSSGADLTLVERGLEDADAQVRRLAVQGAGGVERGPAPARILARAHRDTSYMVRFEGVRAYSRVLQAADCTPLIAAIDDPSAHVALAAIDALGGGCPGGPDPVAALEALADALPADGGAWHKAAHAFLSLARVARENAAGRLAKFGEHPTWQVRMYAARAAAQIMATARLERLAADAHDNVRQAAIDGLAPLRRHDADPIYIAALARPDYQLVLTAATALRDTPNKDRALPALLEAFARLTAERRDTSRDPRMALLQRLSELGGAANAAALKGCLADFDPAIARQCAATIGAWTGSAPAAQPAPRIATSVPAVLPGRLSIRMRRGGAIELRLFGDEAPATVGRVTALARAGHYNGLTFHRVVPNFVVQGGSPGANEYMGDGPYMRDEVGLRTHGRGTLGISTRGRDTGDAQIFINLADNPRLDHNYTVFAEVTAGMDVVDGIVEGDVIERIDVLGPPATQSGR